MGIEGIKQQVEQLEKDTSSQIEIANREAKAETFIATIDPNLTVEMRNTRSVPTDSTPSKEHSFLIFYNPVNDVSWIMVPNDDQEYLETRLRI